MLACHLQSCIQSMKSNHISGIKDKWHVNFEDSAVSEYDMTGEFSPSSWKQLNYFLLDFSLRLFKY